MREKRTLGLVYVTGERMESRRSVIEYDKISVWTRMVGEEFLSCFSESFSPSADPPTTDTSAGGFRFSVLGSQVEFKGSSDVGEGGGCVTEKICDVRTSSEGALICSTMPVRMSDTQERAGIMWLIFFSLGRVLAALPPHLPTIISTGSCRLIGLITSFRFIIPMTASERTAFVAESESRRTRKRFIESKITSRENLARKNLNDTNMVRSTGVCWWCRWYRAPILCSWLMRFAVKKSAIYPSTEFWA